MNKTFIEKAKETIKHKDAIDFLWIEALNTTTYLINISTIMTIRNITLGKAWTGKNPTISHLRIFRCNVHIYIPKEK